MLFAVVKTTEASAEHLRLPQLGTKIAYVLKSG